MFSLYSTLDKNCPLGDIIPTFTEFCFGVVCFFILKNKSKNLKVNLAPYRSLWTLAQAVMIRWWGQKQSGVGCQVNRR